MKRKNFIITIALCISLTPQTNFTAQQPADSWWNWAAQKTQTAKSYASSAMSGLSARMTNIYKKVSDWSNATKASVFLATAGALIALGYNKETLKSAIEQGISKAGIVLNEGLKIIQANPGKIAAVGIGTYGGIKLLQTPQQKDPSMDEYETSITDKTSIAEYVNSLLRDPDLQHADLDGVTNYDKHIDNISRKLYQLLDANNLQDDDQYLKDLTNLQKINDYETNQAIKNKLGDKFKNKIEPKLKEYNIKKGYFWLPIHEIFEILYLKSFDK